MAIYYLDADDEITSAAARIRDFLGPAHCPGAVGRLARGRRRGSTSDCSPVRPNIANKRLAIIAADPTVQSVARSAQLPVYASVAEYEERRSHSGRRRARAAPQLVTAAALDELALTVAPVDCRSVDDRRAPVPERVLHRRGRAENPPDTASSGCRNRARRRCAVARCRLHLVPERRRHPYPAAGPGRADDSERQRRPNVAAANDQAGVVPGLNKAFSVNAPEPTTPRA